MQNLHRGVLRDETLYRSKLEDQRELLRQHKTVTEAE